MSKPKIPPLSLSNLLRDAFFQGRGYAAGQLSRITEEDLDAWTNYSPRNTEIIPLIEKAINEYNQARFVTKEYVLSKFNNYILSEYGTQFAYSVAKGYSPHSVSKASTGRGKLSDKMLADIGMMSIEDKFFMEIGQQ